MTFVVDASFAAAWSLPDETSELTDSILYRLAREPAFVPSLFWHEARNLLLNAERRQRLPAGGAVAAIQRLWRLPIEDRGAGGDAATFSFAQFHSLSAYDAVYLALAAAEEIPLATLDRKLAAAARAEGIVLLGPLSEPL
jgi:predicted nucleic acid-binding protein